MKIYKQNNSIINLLRRLYYNHRNDRIKILYYNYFLKKKMINKVRKRLSEADKRVRIIFFVFNLSQWKYESFFKLLLMDKRFDPIIIPCPYFRQEIEEFKQNEKILLEYCEKYGFPYLRGFDIDRNEYIPAKELKADFISFTQPYNNYPYFWRAENFMNSALIFSYPYGQQTTSERLHNTFIENIAWVNFYNVNDLEIFKSCNITKGQNYKFVGSTFFDSLKNFKTSEFIKDTQSTILKKKIIWAPHHTIDHETDELPFSNFLNMYDWMLQLTEKYKDKIHFIFKPHPALYHRLIVKWGKEKTDKYYDRWATGINTSLALSDYKNLFVESDGMIHDCSGFTNEYLYVNKPVLHCAICDMKKYMGGIALECYNQHYHGSSIDKIDNFISEVVINGNDPKLKDRTKFVQEKLLPPNNRTAAENIYAEFEKFINNDNCSF